MRRKRGLHTIRHRPQFSQVCVQTENTAKKVLRLRQKTAYSGASAFCENFFRKMLTNLTNHPLHIIRVSHGFHPFVPFPSLFANNVRRAYVWMGLRTCAARRHLRMSVFCTTTKARYTLFVNVHKQWQNDFFAKKKMKFCEKWRKGALHTIRHRPQFSRMCVETENTAKKILWISQKITCYGERISRNSFSQHAREYD